MCLFILACWMDCGSRWSQWESLSGPQSCPPALRCNCSRWRFFASNKARRTREEHYPGLGLASDLLLVHVGGTWASLGYFSSPLAGLRARRNPLKIERLGTFQFAWKVPLFRQARDWRKRETVWVI